MAELAKTGRPTPGTTQMSTNSRLSGKVAGEAIVAGDALRIGSDNKLYRASGAANNANAIVRGFAAESASIGQGVTLLRHVNIGYATGLTPGTNLYLSGTVPGGLADAPSTGGLTPIAFVWDATRIHVHC
jgi:hypothetical protein